MHSLWQDVRYAVRGFGATPGFTLIVIATIALGLSLNTTMFTVFNAYVLRPLPVRDPSTLYQLSWSTRSGGGRFFTPADAQVVRAANPAFAEALSYEPIVAKIENRSLFGNLVSENYFSMLGVHAVIGRPLTLTDGEAASPLVAVLSHAAWLAKFEGDATVVGKTLFMFGHPYEVVGVAAPGFNGVGQVPADFWISQAPGVTRANVPAQTVVLRARPGWTRAESTAAVLAWTQQITSNRSPDQRVLSVDLQSNGATLPINPESLAVLAPTAAAFILVLLIASANVANMVLARALGRQREIAIRVALGARRSRIVQQLITESVLLTAVAAVAGFGLSRVTIRATEWLLFATMPSSLSRLIRLVDLAPDVRVFLFIVTASVIAIAVFGVLPVLQATSTDVAAATRSSLAGGARPSRLRNALIVAQTTVCVVLLICAGILLQASRRLGNSDPGFVIRDISAIQLNQSIGPDAIRNLESHPSVGATASAWQAPLTGSLRRMASGPADGTLRVSAGYNFVSPEYFPLLSIPIIRGRNFTPSEANDQSPVVVVSEATAARFWPNQDALGRSISIGATGWQRDRGNPLPRFRTALVVGIARDVISGVVFDGRDETCVYFPTAQGAERNDALLVRFRSDTEVARRSVETLLERLAPGAVMRIAPLEEMFALQVYPFRFSFAIASFLGCLALALTLSGIYGVVSFVVGQRRREIGIRLALGATAAVVVRGVLSQSLRLAVAGTGIGVLISLTASQLLATQLTTVDAFDVAAYLCGIAIALSGAAAAAFVPSRRAAAINPGVTLRSE
jgi:predicted permease